MPSLKVKSRAEVGDSCESCYLDILAAAGLCYNKADYVQCIIDTIGEHCASCICDVLGVHCQENLRKKVPLSMTEKSKAEGDGSCDLCVKYVLESVISCSSSDDFISCLIDDVADECFSCVCDLFEIDCQDLSVGDVLAIPDMNGDVLATCMECGMDVEQVVTKCISAGGAKDIVKCFVDDFPKIDTCIDCICEILETVGVKCEEVKVKYH